MYPNQKFEESLLSVLRKLNNDWDNFHSYEGILKGEAIKNISFPMYGDYEHCIIWYPEKVSFFLNHVWKYQELRRDPKSNKLTSLISIVIDSEFEILYRGLNEKKVNTDVNLLSKYREVKMFGRNLFNLIPPQGQIVHQLDYFLN